MIRRTPPVRCALLPNLSSSLGSPRSRRLALPGLVALAALASACGGPPPKPAKAPHTETKIRTPEAPPSLLGPDAPPIDAYFIGKMDSDESPSALARRGNDALAVYTRAGHLYARKLDVTVAPPPGEPKDEIDLGAHGAFGKVPPHVTATDSGYVLLWDEAIDQTEVFKLRVLDASGKPVADTLSFPPVSDTVKYAGVAAWNGGLILIHESGADGTTSIHATAVDPAGTKILSPPQLIARGVLGWDFAATAKDVTFAVVDAPTSATANDGEPLGPVRAFTVDAKAQKSAEVRVVDQDVSDIDVQVASIEGGSVIAYTDHTDMDGAVKFAVVKGGALAVPPKRISAPLGDAAFVQIVAAPRGAGKRALVAWENIGEAGTDTRVLHYASVGADGGVAPDVGSFLVDKRASHEMAADGDGWAMLMLAPSELASNENTPTAGEDAPPVPNWPMFARVGADLSVRGSEPVRYFGASSKEGVPDVAFDLSCDAGACTALAASAAAPTSLYLAVLPARASKWQPVAWKSETGKRPAIRDARSLVIGDPLFHVASTKVSGAGAVTAWTTYFVDGSTPTEVAPKGEPPYAATLALRFTHDDGTLGDPLVLSKRAVSEGGVAVAELPTKAKSDSVVVWVASEKTGPNLYATRVDADGKKTQQKKLTTLDRSGKSKDAGSTVTSAAIAFAPAPSDPAKRKGKDGGEAFIVGWVDSRDKNGEVYVARMSKDLDKTVGDTRVTKADGDAADVDILVHDNDVYVAYSDMREGENADIYLARLEADTLKVKDEGRVYASGAHSHGPKLAMAGNQLMAAWIEDGPEASTIAGATIRVAALDPTGKLVAAPFVVEAPKPALAAITGVASFAFTCGATVDSCKIAFSAQLDQGQVLFGLPLGKDGAPGAPVHIAFLSTAPLTDTSLAFTDPTATTLTLLEQANVGRARLVHLDW
ncbi:MAG: hypothetical protein U0414_00310 [Polyangiaceae bacterium]